MRMIENLGWLALGLALVGVPVLILLVELVDMLRAFVRRLRGAEAGAPEHFGAFTMRRPESALRTRHRRRVRFNPGRPSEINRHQVEPYVR